MLLHRNIRASQVETNLYEFLTVRGKGPLPGMVNGPDFAPPGAYLMSVGYKRHRRRVGYLRQGQGPAGGLRLRVITYPGYVNWPSEKPALSEICSVYRQRRSRRPADTRWPGVNRIDYS